jgi:hypothetical protein
MFGNYFDSGTEGDNECFYIRSWYDIVVEKICWVPSRTKKVVQYKKALSIQEMLGEMNNVLNSLKE